MFKCFFKLVILYGLQQVISQSVNVEKRVNAFRHKLKKQIRGVQQSFKVDEPQEFLDNYDLIVGEPTEVLNKQPHLRSGHRHRHRVRKHRARANATVGSTTNYPEALTTITDGLKTTTIISNVTNDSFETNVKILEENVEAAMENLTDYLKQSEIRNVLTTTYSPRRGNQKVTHRVPFFRRFNYVHDSERNKPQKWVHCLDLIAPRLLGMKDEAKLHIVTPADNDVRRLAQLLFTNVSQFNAQDMVSLLAQISNINIRMFQWEQNAITMIFNIIIKGPVHNFKTLKTGIMVLISKWHLDLSNMFVFLEQTRIFRPTCIDISGFSGFTKEPGITIPYTKPAKPTKKYRDPNVSCKSSEKKEPYDNGNP